MSSYDLVIDGQPLESELNKSGDGYQVSIDGVDFKVLPLGSGKFSIESDGSRTTVCGFAAKDVIYVEIASRVYEFKERSDDTTAGGGGDQDTQPDKIFAPMPGKIVKLMVSVGDEVAARQQAVIVEAMKMENPVLTQAAGKVKAVHFDVGDQVDTENPIIELEIGD